jgi:hypothetical protein
MTDIPDSAALAAARPASFVQRHGGKLLLSLLFGAGLAWLLLRGGFPLVPPAGAFASTRPWAVVAYVLSLAAVHWFRAARWRHLLRPLGEVPLLRVIAVSWVGFGAILISPLRSGEIVRPYLITRKSSVKLWEATGTVGAERIIDGLSLSILLFLALSVSTPLSPLPDHIGKLEVPAAAVPVAAHGALALFMAAFVAMGLFFFFRDRMRWLLRHTIGLVSVRLADRLSDIVERVAEGIRFLPSLRYLAPFLLETLAYWACNAGGVWLLGWGTGLSGMTLAEAIVTMGVVGIGILVPSGPGYFGAFQLSTFAALALYFPESALLGPGAAFAFLLYACQVGFHLVATAIGLAIDPDRPGDAQALP